MSHVSVLQSPEDQSRQVDLENWDAAEELSAFVISQLSGPPVMCVALFNADSATRFTAEVFWVSRRFVSNSTSQRACYHQRS